MLNLFETEIHPWDSRHSKIVCASFVPSYSIRPRAAQPFHIGSNVANRSKGPDANVRESMFLDKCELCNRSSCGSSRALNQAGREIFGVGFMISCEHVPTFGKSVTAPPRQTRTRTSTPSTTHAPPRRASPAHWTTVTGIHDEADAYGDGPGRKVQEELRQGESSLPSWWLTLFAALSRIYRAELRCFRVPPQTSNLVRRQTKVRLWRTQHVAADVPPRSRKHATRGAREWSNQLSARCSRSRARRVFRTFDCCLRLLTSPVTTEPGGCPLGEYPRTNTEAVYQQGSNLWRYPRQREQRALRNAALLLRGPFLPVVRSILHARNWLSRRSSCGPFLIRPRRASPPLFSGYFSGPGVPASCPPITAR